MGIHSSSKEEQRENLWCKPVWKFAGGKERHASIKEYKAQLGWWGMELAKRLVESQKVPIFIVNGAAEEPGSTSTSVTTRTRPISTRFTAACSGE